MGFYCENCGKKVEINTEECPNCGVLFKAVKCPKCSYTGRPGDFIKGCPSCGYLAGHNKNDERISFPDNRKKPCRTYLSDRLFWILAGVLLILLIILIRTLIKGV